MRKNRKFIREFFKTGPGIFVLFVVPTLIFVALSKNSLDPIWILLYPAVLIGIATAGILHTAAEDHKKVVAVVFGFFAVGIGWVVLMAITLRSVPGKTIFVQVHTRVLVATFVDSKDMWRWDKRLRDTVMYSYGSQDVYTEMKLNPISENPKVRDLEYFAKVNSADTPEKRMLYIRETNDEPIDQWVKRQLYEFNEQHSKEMARFYNPLYDQQQGEFNKLVQNFLEPRCKAVGLEYGHARFALL